MSNQTLPSCTTYVSGSDYSATAAANFNPQQASYYKSNITYCLPAIIIGGICWIFAIIFFLWQCSICCRRVTWRNWRTKRFDEEADRPRRRLRNTLITMAVVLLTAGTIGTSIWGLVEGLQKTDGRVQNFWDVLGDVRNTLEGIQSDGQGLVNNITAVGTALVTASNAIPSLQTQLNLAGFNVPQLESELNSAESATASAASSGQSVLDNLQSDGINSINSIFKQQDRTNHYYDTYRVVALAVLFGVYMAFSLIVGLLTSLGRMPRTNSAFTLIFWLLVGLVLVIGSGVLLGALHVSKDACLYAQNYIVTLVNQKDAGSRGGIAVSYYLGNIQVPDNEVLEEIFGLNASVLAAYRAEPGIQKLENFLQSDYAPLILQSGVPPISQADQSTILGIPALLNGTQGGINTLQAAVNVNNIYPLYIQAKALICCDLISILFTLWLAWTITGALGGAEAVLATWASFYSLVPKDYSKEDLANTGRGSPTAAQGSGPPRLPDIPPTAPKCRTRRSSE
ncbi:hypothetical protein WJX73_000800 [Symbiochloris irregularis]|uniref:Uncharacterized protein n=1 Tax=Symbiochloris irregularis TaxID=706552 RepID=A0AAW1NU05_9CHLO